MEPATRARNPRRVCCTPACRLNAAVEERGGRARVPAWPHYTQPDPDSLPIGLCHQTLRRANDGLTVRLSLFDQYTAAVDAQPVFGKQLNGTWIDLVLLLEDPSS